MTDNNKSAEAVEQTLALFKEVLTDAKELPLQDYLHEVSSLISHCYFLGKSDALRWVPVGERLPGSHTPVFAAPVRAVVRREPVVDERYKHGTYGWFLDGDAFFFDNEITHWLPLPPLPEAKV